MKINMHFFRSPFESSLDSPRSLGMIGSFPLVLSLSKHPLIPKGVLSRRTEGEKYSFKRDLISIFVVLMAMNTSTVAMRCTRRPIVRPVVHAARQKCLPRSQRSYSTIWTPNKYHSQLIYSEHFKQHCFNLRNMENYNLSFSIQVPLLQHLMVQHKMCYASLQTDFYETVFKILHNMVQEKSEYDYSRAYDFESKLSLFLMLKYIRWDGTMKQLSEYYPDTLLFPILVNEKEVVLRVSANYDDRKTRDIGLDGLSLYSSPGLDEDAKHHNKIMQKYNQFFEEKL